jgi:hypothetical protein
MPPAARTAKTIYESMSRIDRDALWYTPGDTGCIGYQLVDAYTAATGLRIPVPALRITENAFKNARTYSQFLRMIRGLADHTVIEGVVEFALEATGSRTNLNDQYINQVLRMPRFYFNLVRTHRYRANRFVLWNAILKELRPFAQHIMNPMFGLTPAQLTQLNNETNAAAAIFVENRPQLNYDQLMNQIARQITDRPMFIQHYIPAINAGILKGMSFSKLGAVSDLHLQDAWTSSGEPMVPVADIKRVFKTVKSGKKATATTATGTRKRPKTPAMTPALLRKLQLLGIL